MVLLPATSFTHPAWQRIGSDLWPRVASSLGAKRLAKQAANSGNAYRSPEVQVLGGEDGWVTHIDNGIKYRFDVTRCMFSAGNVTEKVRVANMDCRQETVVDMYAGIGYFSLPYLVHAGAAFLHACEWNPAAVEALRINLQLNDVMDRAVVYQGDNREVCPVGVADRVNLGLIPSSRAGWPTACRALKPHSGGVLHIHDNVDSKPHDINKKQCDTQGVQYGTVVKCCLQANPVNAKNSAPTCQCSHGNKQHSNIVPTTSDSNIDTKTCSDSVSMDSNYTTLELHSECSQHTCSAVCAGLCAAWHSWMLHTQREIQAILVRQSGKAWAVRATHVEHVKSYAPHIDHLVLDLDCRPL